MKVRDGKEAREESRRGKDRRSNSRGTRDTREGERQRRERKNLSLQVFLFDGEVILPPFQSQPRATCHLTCSALRFCFKIAISFSFSCTLQ